MRALLVVLLLLSACTATVDGTPTAIDCPSSPLPPDPDRPQIGLGFEVSSDLSTVRGTESVTFTPDLPISELVFRLTPNSPGTPARLEIRTVQVEGLTAEFETPRAGARADTDGGLLVVPLEEESPAGQAIEARIEFLLHIEESSAFERVGRSGDLAWWGSGQPLLAWERGVGWHTEPLAGIHGETATSEAADIRLTVTAPEDYEVVGTGMIRAGADVPGTRWTARAPTARDVAIVVGDLHVRHFEGLTVASYDEDQLEDLTARTRYALLGLGRLVGEQPYESLAMISLPMQGGGIEYPGAILLAGLDEAVITHEVAHQWFYGMVGDSQARDPWLDEAFATFAQQWVDGDLSADALEQDMRVDEPMTHWAEHPEEYGSIVYAKGAAALARVEEEIGPENFELVLRCYVNEQAWRIADPDDVRDAFANYPEAIRALRAAGALS